MKTFDIITEADARILPRGETVTLARGGHVTPLAEDTIRERKIVVIREGTASDDDAALAPVHDIRSVAIAGDARGASLCRVLVPFLRGRGLRVLNLSPDDNTAADFPDVAAAVAFAVARREADAGIVVDATGIGAAVAANKVAGIRAAAVTSGTLARHAREQLGANVLTLGAAVVTSDEAADILTVWLGTPIEDSRILRSLARIRDLERRQTQS